MPSSTTSAGPAGSGATRLQGATRSQPISPCASTGPGVTTTSSPTNSAVDFAATARLLSRAARLHGCTAPSFRSPPRLVGVDRSIRRHHNGVVVAVAVRRRPWTAVLADMVEGVVVANQLQPPAADRLRAALWSAVLPEAEVTRPTSPCHPSAA